VPFAPSRTRRASSRGQSLVELALIAPVFLILLMTAIDLGRLMYSQITITNAAKEAALVASQGGTWQANQPCSDTNTVMCGALTEAQDGFVVVEQTRVTLTPKTCEANATYPSGGPPTVAVEVNSPFRLLTPIIGSIVGSNIVLRSTANAECLAVPAVTFPSLPSPIAAFTAAPMSGTAPLTVTFNASGSSSPGATIASYSWSFGGSAVTANNTFPAGTHTVVLTVTDSRGQSDTASATITVTGGGGGPTPTPTPTCPSVSFTATPKNANQHSVDFSGSISDGSNGWAWVWSGAFNDSGQNLNNHKFPAAGTYSVTLTATKGPCAPTTTQTVTAP
jgi:PKD repeat protein